MAVAETKAFAQEWQLPLNYGQERTHFTKETTTPVLADNEAINNPTVAETVDTRVAIANQPSPDQTHLTKKATTIVANIEIIAESKNCYPTPPNAKVEITIESSNCYPMLPKSYQIHQRDNQHSTMPISKSLNRQGKQLPNHCQYRNH